MKILQTSSSIFIHQKKYASSFLSKFGLKKCKVVTTHLVVTNLARMMVVVLQMKHSIGRLWKLVIPHSNKTRYHVWCKSASKVYTVSYNQTLWDSQKGFEIRSKDFGLRSGICERPKCSPHWLLWQWLEWFNGQYEEHFRVCFLIWQWCIFLGLDFKSYCYSNVAQVYFGRLWRILSWRNSIAVW